MKEYIKKYFDDEKYALKSFIIIILFLTAIKLPSIINTDIQPWDEGMYALRCLSISESGDFIDQTNHSVGGYYSASHPPLLIWIGFLLGSVFGFTNILFKSITFAFGLGCIGIIIMIGKNFFTQRTGIIAALIFSSNIIFNIFSKRFQFDMPYIFLTLVSFYFIMYFLKTGEKKYNIYAGIFFGLFLMLKILIGFYVPMVMMLAILLSKKKINYRISDLVTLLAVGIIIALPWHLYMIINHGKEFLNYFFFFHIYERAIIGVEGNIKSSGPLYYINYLFTILPLSILIFYGFYKLTSNYREISKYNLLLFIWFITGFIIITVFKTKLEVYALIVLAPAVFLIAEALDFLKEENKFKQSVFLAFIFYNIMWMILNTYRIEFDMYIFHKINIFTVIILFLIPILLSYIYYKSGSDLHLKRNLEIIIILFFLINNIRYALIIPLWENAYKISDVKNLVEKSGIKTLVYVGSHFRYNPQFSFYFDGLDINWKNDKYNFVLLDTKNGSQCVMDSLNKIPGSANVIIEKHNINRGWYPASDSIIDKNYNLVLKTYGYELYRK